MKTGMSRMNNDDNRNSSNPSTAKFTLQIKAQKPSITPGGFMGLLYICPSPSRLILLKVIFKVENRELASK
jgi:hypothetical protein